MAPRNKRRSSKNATPSRTLAKRSAAAARARGTTTPTRATATKAVAMKAAATTYEAVGPTDS